MGLVDVRDAVVIVGAISSANSAMTICCPAILWSVSQAFVFRGRVRLNSL